MGYVTNHNAHRVAIARPGLPPLRLSAGATIEADGELLDSLLATRGVESASKTDHDKAVKDRDVEADNILAAQESGESYKAPEVLAQEELEAGYPDAHDGGSALSNPPIDPRTGEPVTPQSGAEAARHEIVGKVVDGSGASLEQVVGVGEVAPETSPIVGVGSTPDLIPGSGVATPDANAPAESSGEREAITDDYESHTNAELDAEAKARGVEVDGRTKADYVSALEADDAKEPETAPEPESETANAGGSE